VPVQSRHRADQDQQRAGGDLGLRARLAVADRHALEPRRAGHARDLGVVAHGDVGRGVDRGDQVARHARRERVAAHEDRHLPGEAGEVDGRLPRRVAAAHHVGVLAAERVGVGDRGAVEDARAGQLGDARRVEAAVGDAGGEHDRAPRRLRAVLHPDQVALGAGLERGDLVHEQELGAEGPRLLVGALGELGAGHAAGEAEVVADVRARAGLTADRLALDHERAQALRGRVDGRREPRGSRADHDHVVVALSRQVGRHPVGRGELDVGRVDERAAVEQDDDRLAAAVAAPVHGQDPRAAVARRVVEDVRDAVAGQQRRQLVHARGPLAPDDRDLRRARGVRARELVQELRHGPVEELVGRAPRLDHVEVEVAPRHALEDRRRGVGLAPGGPVDQQRAPRAGVQPAGPAQQLRAGQARHPLVGQHERDARPLLAQALERGQRVVARPAALDAVVAGIAALELGAHPGEPLGVVVGGEQDGTVRHEPTLAAGPVASLRPVPLTRSREARKEPK
jgi:hypothetical protein